MIDYAGLKVDNDKVYVGEVTNKDPFLVSGKQLVIPTREILRNIDGNSMVMFHPLSEDIIKGESSVVIKLRYAINIRINITIGILIQSLLNLAASPEHHKKLSPEQSELLYNIKDIDEKTARNFVTYMLKEVKDKEDRLFSYVYLKRGGTLANVKYPRVGIVSFPFFQALLEGEKFKFRIKDVEACKAVFEYMFSEATDHEAYNYGSRSEIAPYLDALLVTSYKLTERLNEIIELYQDYIDDPDSIYFNHDWYDTLKEIETFKNEIKAIPNHIVEPIPESVVPSTPVPEYNRPVYANPNQYNNQYVNPPMQPNVPIDPNSFEGFRRMTGIGHSNINFGGVPNNGYARPSAYSGDLLNRNVPVVNQYGGYPNQMNQNYNQYPNQNIGFTPMGYNPTQY